MFQIKCTVSDGICIKWKKTNGVKCGSGPPHLIQWSGICRWSIHLHVHNVWNNHHVGLNIVGMWDWPPGSPDLTPLFFSFFREQQKIKFIKIHNHSIRNATTHCSICCCIIQTLLSMNLPSIQCIQKCIDASDYHFEQLLLLYELYNCQCKYLSIHFSIILWVVMSYC